jgi:hypothetical protein
LKLKVSSVTDSLKWTNAIEPIERFCAHLQHRQLSN